LDISNEGAMYLKISCGRKGSGAPNPEEPGIEGGPEILAAGATARNETRKIALSINPPCGTLE
jgi:hypothetical protein